MRWSHFKDFVDNYNLIIHWRISDDNYILEAMDNNGLRHQCTLDYETPTPDPSDQKEFEDNYKALGNVSATDHDNAPYMRMKGATKGWTFQVRSMEFKLGTLNSLKNLDINEADYGDAVIKFYNSSNVELTAGTQAELDANCVRTDLEWTYPADIEMIGGSMKAVVQPTNDVRVWCQGAPDYGGPVMISGINFRIRQECEIDGRVVKRMTYAAPIPGSYPKKGNSS